MTSQVYIVIQNNNIPTFNHNANLNNTFNNNFNNFNNNFSTIIGVFNYYPSLYSNTATYSILGPFPLQTQFFQLAHKSRGIPIYDASIHRSTENVIRVNNEFDINPYAPRQGNTTTNLQLRHNAVNDYYNSV